MFAPGPLYGRLFVFAAMDVEDCTLEDTIELEGDEEITGLDWITVSATGVEETRTLLKDETGTRSHPVPFQTRSYCTRLLVPTLLELLVGYEL